VPTSGRTTTCRRWCARRRLAQYAKLTVDAGVLNLLYGLTVSRISRLRTADLHTHGDRAPRSSAATGCAWHRPSLSSSTAVPPTQTAGCSPGGHPGTHASAGLHRKLKPS
jgi:hypothetical protein